MPFPVCKTGEGIVGYFCRDECKNYGLLLLRCFWIYFYCEKGCISIVRKMNWGFSRVNILGVSSYIRDFAVTICQLSSL